MFFDAFDFNKDGEVDAAEFALGMMIMEEVFGDEDEEEEEDEEEDES